MIKNNFQKKLILVISVCAVTAAAFIFRAHQLDLPYINNLKNDAFRVEIAGRVFKIPKGYFDGAKALGRDNESVVLEYSLPGFEFLPPHPQYRKERQKLISEGRKRSMLLENARQIYTGEARLSFDVLIPRLMHGREFKKEKNTVYGLDKYVHQVPKPVSNDPAYAPYVQDDFLIERNADGSINSYLLCSPPGRDKIPACRHSFIDKGLLYQIHWRVQELPNWKAQRDSAIQFIDGLEQSASTK